MSAVAGQDDDRRSRELINTVHRGNKDDEVVAGSGAASGSVSVIYKIHIQTTGWLDDF